MYEIQKLQIPQSQNPMLTICWQKRANLLLAHKDLKANVGTMDVLEKTDVQENEARKVDLNQDAKDRKDQRAMCLGLKDWMDRKEQQEKTVRKECAAYLDVKASEAKVAAKESAESEGFKDRNLPDHKESKAHKELDLKAKSELTDHKGIKVILDHKDHKERESLGQRDLRVTRAKSDPRDSDLQDHKESKVVLEIRDAEVHAVIKDLTGSKAQMHMGHKDSKDHKDIKAILAQRAKSGSKVGKDGKDHKDFKVLLAHRDLKGQKVKEPNIIIQLFLQVPSTREI